MMNKMLSLKSRLFCLMAFFAALTSIPAVVASPASVAKQGIQKALVKRNQARQHHDLNGYMATFTPNWETTNVQGRVVTYATLRKSMAASFAKPTTFESAPVRYLITAIVVQGKTAQITIKAHFNYPVQKAPAGPVYRFRSTVASQLWVRGLAGWQLRQEHYLADNIEFSAKPTPN